MIKMETLDRGRILAEINLKAENMRTQDVPFYSDNKKKTGEKVVFGKIRTWSMEALGSNLNDANISQFKFRINFKTLSSK